MSALKVSIYMRPGCHLCDEAVSLVRPLARDAGYDVELVDIEGDDELHRRYLEAIPVIVKDGREVARLDKFRDSGFEQAFVAS